NPVAFAVPPHVQMPAIPTTPRRPSPRTSEPLHRKATSTAGFVDDATEEVSRPETSVYCLFQGTCIYYIHYFAEYSTEYLKIYFILSYLFITIYNNLVLNKSSWHRSC